MARQACISIGIDRYQFFQPLNFASADAHSVQSFCTDEIGLNREQCLLMTDNSTTVAGHSTLPNRENIQEFLDQWCWEILESGDFLCFFFSGYGASTSSGEYLLPIDADPQRMEQTGLSLAHLYRQFSAPGISVLVFLDVNRSGGPSQGFGQQASQLAAEFGIPTFLSCQPQEFSREAMGLRHSIFTAALLEALRFNPYLSFEHLQSYLASRVPELSEQHWQPIQHPVVLLPNNPNMLRPIFDEGQQFSAFVPRSGFSQRLEPELPPQPNSSSAQSAIVPYQSKYPTKKHKPKKQPSYKNPLLVGTIGTVVALVTVLSAVVAQHANKTPTAAPLSSPALYLPSNNNNSVPDNRFELEL
jgi:hypothetical protein